MPRSLVLHVAPSEHSHASALLAKGFRPFFLLAALFAVVAVPLWLFVVHGTVATPPYLDPTTFHAHEMLHGYTVAVLAGFLLTAVANWTQRETATGPRLLALTSLWIAGRVAMLASGTLTPVVVAALDLSFLPALIFVLARPLLAANSRRNWVMLGILGALWLANAAVHLGALGWLSEGVGRRANAAALNLIAFVTLLMAARIFPMFTKNATGVTSIRSLPRLDRAALAALLLAAVLELLVPSSRGTGVMFGAAGLLAMARSARWGARHAWRNPLLWSLHVGHAWLCLGLLLRGASILGAPLLRSLAIHALTVGAVGGLTLGMMARVALGHTGRMLVAPRAMLVAFLAVNLAALVRCFGPLVMPADYMKVITVSGCLWALAFMIFLFTYTPVLLRPRVDGRPG
jgi:uncharacterized protein involved in response to NO